MRSASRSEVLSTPIGSKFAASSSTSVVSSATSDSSPPMIAASATAFSPSVINRSLGRSRRSVPSSVSQRLFLVRAADDDPAAGELRAVERMQRAPPHVHDVVRHVDDVRDRTHPREVEPAAKPLRRRPDPNAAEHAADVARTAFEVLDPDLDGLGVRDRRIIGLGQPQLAAAERGDLSRDPDHRQQVGPVHRRRRVEHLVDERQDVGERRPRREPVREQHDPVVVGAEADLVLGEDHPLGHLAAERALLERPREARKERAGQADRDRGAGAEVPGAADDLLRVGVADVDLAQLQAVGVRVRLRREDVADDEMAEVASLVRDADVGDALDLERRDGETLRDRRRRRRSLDVLPEPAHGDPHQNCLAKRRSLRQSSRRSGNSWRSIAMRSRPIPNANPV